MKRDIKKYYLYRFLVYKFEKLSCKNPSIKEIKPENKEKILLEATRTSQKIILVLGILYVLLNSALFIYLRLSDFQNPLFMMYTDYIDYLGQLINGEWGGSWRQKKASFLMIALLALPIVLIEGGPFFLLVLLIGNWVLKRKIRFVREHKGVESHG
ncbi:hypothetical protein HMPREF2805_03295 [Streptococcus sp. HMSC034E03]|uniref:hypothetical protein n=1 Tax=Streptococcus sp. HMSC034E03 TaxID=1739309 RepID=UPI0008BB238B|nr:hypothetical protein [Streptococcus sp. HMSC034E03]OFK75941.1 hypothetical protein HMPREF2805_03295 [Streptococcus sp. HMSC034E03]